MYSVMLKVFSNLNNAMTLWLYFPGIPVTAGKEELSSCFTALQKCGIQDRANPTDYHSKSVRDHTCQSGICLDKTRAESDFAVLLAVYYKHSQYNTNGAKLCLSGTGPFCAWIETHLGAGCTKEEKHNADITLGFGATEHTSVLALFCEEFLSKALSG